MKFTDGQWLLQPGVSSHYATETYAVQCHADRVVVLATTRPIKHRGDTLAGPTLTLTLSSPAARRDPRQRRALRGPRAAAPARARCPARRIRPVQIVETETEVTLHSRRALGGREEGRRLAPDVPRRSTASTRLTRSDWRSLGYVQWAGQGQLRARAAHAGGGRVRLRPGRALHAVRQERPGGREREQGRRHRLRAGLQERALLPDQPRLRRVGRTSPARCRFEVASEKIDARAVQPRGREPGLLRDLRPDAEGRAAAA